MAGGYMEGYGVADERRSRVIRYIVLSTVAVVILVLLGYWLSRDYSEKGVAKGFLTQLNQHHYQTAYSTWCPKACEHYDYDRFMADWAASKIKSPWKIDSVDSCKGFLTVNVTADGAELQSLSVERGTNTLSFAPAPECQEYKWHWKQFLRRLLGSDTKAGNARPPLRWRNERLSLSLRYNKFIRATTENLAG